MNGLDYIRYHVIDTEKILIAGDLNELSFGEIPKYAIRVMFHLTSENMNTRSWTSNRFCFN